MIATHSAKDLRIQFEVEIDAPPSKVWGKMSTLEGMNEWFSQNLIFEHEVGGQFQMQGQLPGEGPYKFTGEVVRIREEKELAFTWRSEVGEDGDWGDKHTLVTFELVPLDGGRTMVKLTHSGFGVLGDEQADKAYEGHLTGWTMSEPLSSLKAAVEGA